VLRISARVLPAGPCACSFSARCRCAPLTRRLSGAVPAAGDCVFSFDLPPARPSRLGRPSGANPTRFVAVPAHTGSPYVSGQFAPSDQGRDSGGFRSPPYRTTRSTPALPVEACDPDTPVYHHVPRADPRASRRPPFRRTSSCSRSNARLVLILELSQGRSTCAHFPIFLLPSRSGPDARDPGCGY